MFIVKNMHRVRMKFPATFITFTKTGRAALKYSKNSAGANLRAFCGWKFIASMAVSSCAFCGRKFIRLPWV